MKSLAESKALVMGASSTKGIGAAIAGALKAAGADVLISARREDALAAVAEELGVHHHPCDITAAESVAALFAWVDDHFGGLDTAVFSTGLNHFTPIRDFDAEAAMPCLQTQFIGGLTFIRESAARMPGGGSIIMLSSLTASRPAFGTSVYAGSKAGLEQVTRVAALEYAEQGVRVNAIAPGMTRTEMTEGMFGNPNLERAVLEEIPLGRMGTSEDIAHAAVFLAHPACFMTGETLSVTGGAELRRIPTLKEIMG
ncbi:MAG: SDR family oxidoreductase [Xanthomonadales bacterium]|jgi:NAD(P)-dependent dehydrogenase (short-subunit alcohol dehydrogenase family)|nr:SDR family oxidoreductase [Xanthomonadales bacterium]